MAGTALEEHPGADRLPDGLRPGGEGGWRLLVVPGLRLVHDGAEGGTEVDCGPVALAPALAGVVAVRRGHQVDETEIRNFR